jgi:endonuclease/exonuclease/phosphatase family metal-dependent hydrolase
LTGRLADSLGFDEIHQVCLSGFKFLGIGIPTNLSEGISILARKDLHLTKTVVPKLSDDFSLCGDFFSIQFQESNYALIGSIELQKQKIILLNTHLRYIVRMTNEVTAFLSRQLEPSLVQKPGYKKVIGKIAGLRESAREEIKKLAELIMNNCADDPVIIGGDFNLEPDDELILDFTHSQKLIDVLGEDVQQNRITWDPVDNGNARISTFFVSAGGDSLDLFGKTAAMYDMKPRRVDYILLNNKFIKEDILTADIVMNRAQDGTHVSDHYGVFAEIELSRVTAEESNADSSGMQKREKSFEILPIISYDNDVGLGYGAKTFFLNYLQCKESFDIVAFNSTKGERWYRFVFSLPDFEIRQGTDYPWAFDVIADFDKYIKNNFFGTGEATSFSQREYYTKTPFEFSMNLSRGFTRNIVLQAGIKYRSVNTSNFEPGSKFYSLPDPAAAEQ